MNRIRFAFVAASLVIAGSASAQPAKKDTAKMAAPAAKMAAPAAMAAPKAEAKMAAPAMKKGMKKAKADTAKKQ